MHVKRGSTLIELLIIPFILIIIGMGVYSLLTPIQATDKVVVFQDRVRSDVRTQIDSLSDHIRNAQISGTQAFSAATGTGITYYTDDGTTIRYALSGTTLQRIVNGGTPSPVLTNVQSLSFTYYKIPLDTNNNKQYNGVWTTTADSHAPTSGEMPYLGGVQINMTVSRDGCTGSYETVVRLRNSPYKG